MAHEYFTCANFIAKYGWEKLTKFTEMMNQGASLKEMSSEIGLSMSQLSRYRDTMFQVRYVPKLGTKRYMEEWADRDQLRLESKSSFILKISA